MLNVGGGIRSGQSRKATGRQVQQARTVQVHRWREDAVATVSASAWVPQFGMIGQDCAQWGVC